MRLQAFLFSVCMWGGGNGGELVFRVTLKLWSKNWSKYVSNEQGK